MIDTRGEDQTRRVTWGWRILLAVSVLFGLNGVGWFFSGPEATVTNMAEYIGIPAIEFEDAHPVAADEIAAEARRVAVYLTAIGTMASLAALAGIRNGARWAWHITWVLIATAAAIGSIELAGGLGIFGASSFALAAIALIGQVLVGPRRRRYPADQGPSRRVISTNGNSIACVALSRRDGGVELQSISCVDVDYR